MSIADFTKALYVPDYIYSQLFGNGQSKSGDIFVSDSSLSQNTFYKAELRIDWVTGCCHDLARFEITRKLVEELWQAPLVHAKGLNRYTDRLENGWGVMLLYSAEETSCNHKHFSLVVPGHALAILDIFDNLRLLRFLHANGFNYPRLDIAMDIFDPNLLDLHYMLKLGQEGEVAGARRYKIIGEGKIGQLPVMTLYMGSRSSDKYARFYDKLAQTGLDKVAEKMDIAGLYWHRLELELKNHYAKQFVDGIVGLSDDRDAISEGLGWAYRSALLDTVDFVRKKHHNLSRCERYEFWENFLQGATKFGFRPKDVPNPTIDRFKHWVKHAAAPILATILITTPYEEFHDWVHSLIDDGLDRLGVKHELALSQNRSLTLMSEDKIQKLEESLERNERRRRAVGFGGPRCRETPG